jgi:hypothetical protein
MKNLSLFSVRCILMAIALTTIFGTGGSLFAQYPLLPAESNGNANYEWRPDLGGWRDKQTNLVWGYDTQPLSGSYQYSALPNVGPSYPQMFSSAAQSKLSSAVNQENLAASETDPIRKQRRLDFAAISRADAAACVLAGADAARFSNWRVPSSAEFQSAYSKGLFGRGPGAFNYDGTPFTGYQPVYLRYWTSDPPTGSRRVVKVFNAGDGTIGQTSVNSVFYVLVVRSGL